MSRELGGLVWGRPKGASDRTLGHQAGEVVERPVVGPLGLGRETTAGQLSRFEMMGDTVATRSPAITGLVGTRTGLLILFFLALHRTSISSLFRYNGAIG